MTTSVHEYIDLAEKAVNQATWDPHAEVAGTPYPMVTLPAHIVSILCVEARNANQHIPR